MTLSTGSRLGPYEITAAIGAGGMGEVYRARDTQLGRDVAIKVLPLHESATRRGIELPNTTYVIPLQPGWMARLPASGFPSIDAAAAALGRRLTLGDRVFPSPDPSIYAFPRLSSHRNSFRIQVQ
jgi:serine/threonine protein kinase